MNSRRHHCLKHRGRFRQTESLEIPTSPEPPSPNLSDCQGCLPPPHTPELPVFRNRFPSLNHPFPPNTLPHSQWLPPNHQAPLPQNVVPFNQSYLPSENSFTSSSPPKSFVPQTQFGSINPSTSEARPPQYVFLPDQPSQNRIHWADGGSKHHEYSSSHKSKSSKYSHSSASSHSNISRPTSAEGYSDYSQKENHSDCGALTFDKDDLKTGLDILAKYQPCTSCSLNATNKLPSPNIIGRPPAPSGYLTFPWKDCKSQPSTNDSVSPEHPSNAPQQDYNNQPSIGVPAPAEYSLDLQQDYESRPSTDVRAPTEYSLDLPQRDYESQPSTDVPAPSEYSSDLPQEDYESQPLDNAPVEILSRIEDSTGQPETPPSLVRCEADQKKRKGLCCNRCSSGKKRQEAKPSNKWNFVQKIKRGMTIKSTQMPSKWGPHLEVTFHFAYIVLLAAAASLCIHSHEPVEKADDLQKTTTLATVRKALITTPAPTPVSEEEPTWFNRLGIRLPDHWVAIRVPDDEHEEQFLRKFFLGDGQRERKKTLHRHTRPKENDKNQPNKTQKGRESQTNNTIHRRTGGKEKNRHHQSDRPEKNVLSPEVNAQQDAWDNGTVEQKAPGYHKDQPLDSDSKDDSTEESTETVIITSQKIPTQNPLRQDELFIQRLKDHHKGIKTATRPTRRNKSLHHTARTTTPLTNQVTNVSSATNPDDNVLVTNKTEEKNKIILRNDDNGSEIARTRLAQPPDTLQQNPVIPYKFKKKIHLTQPTRKEKPPPRPPQTKSSTHILEDLPENVLRRSKINRRPMAHPKDRAGVLRFPDTSVLHWNKTYFYNRPDEKWNDEHSYYIGKKQSHIDNRLGTAKRDSSDHDNPEVIINPGSNEMIAPPTLLVIQDSTEKSSTKEKSQYLSGNTTDAIFIVLNVLFFTLVGSATLFLWDLHGRMVGLSLCVIPFLVFNVFWFTSIATAFIIFGSQYWSIAILLLIIVLLHIIEVSMIMPFGTAREKKRPHPDKTRFE